MNKYTKRVIPLVIGTIFFTIVIIVSLVWLIYWSFFSIQRIEGQEILQEVSSPNGKYTVIAYLNNGSATSDFSVLGEVRDNETGKERNIYWKYHCSDAEIVWKDDKTIVVNGVELDVLEDSYDWRRE